MVYTGDLKSPVFGRAGSSPAPGTIYRRNCMSKQQDTLDKAYGNVPKEVGYTTDMFTWLPTYRGIKYYWYKLLRKLTR